MNPPWNDESLLLVTGASGFVGSHVVDEARKRGLRVRAFVRQKSDLRLLQAWGVEVYFGNLADPYSFVGALRSVTHVVHCAALVKDWGRLEDFRELNTKSVEALIDAVGQHGNIQRIVHLSTMGVYESGDHHGSTEEAPFAKQPHSPYSQSKIEAEKCLIRSTHRDHLPIVILRPGYIYGIRDRTVIPRVVKTMRQKLLPYVGTGSQLMANTYVDHLVQAIFLGLERPEAVGEAFNIMDGRSVTRREFFESIAKELEIPPPTWNIPPALARGTAQTLETIWHFFGREEAPPLTTTQVKFLDSHLEFSIEKARTRLGYQPTVDFQEAMKTTMDWFKKGGI